MIDGLTSARRWLFPEMTGNCALGQTSCFLLVVSGDVGGRFAFHVSGRASLGCLGGVAARTVFGFRFALHISSDASLGCLGWIGCGRRRQFSLLRGPPGKTISLLARFFGGLRDSSESSDMSWGDHEYS
jgi:hypothetical protein